MAIIFAGNQLSDFNLPNAGALESTTASGFDSSWVPNSLQAPNYNQSPLQPPLFTAQPDFWFHAEVFFNTLDSIPATLTSVVGVFLRLYDNGGVERWRIGHRAGGFVFRRWNGSAWVELGVIGSSVYNTDVRYQFDIRIVVNGASSSIEVYLNRALVGTLTGLTISENIAGFGLSSATSSSQATNATFWSQVIIADENSLFLKYRLSLPTGNSSTNTAFTGDFTAVDEAILNDSDFITSTVADQVETYTSAARDFTGYTIKTVVLNYRALRNTTGPQNIQGCLRSGGTNYFTATNTLALGFQNYRAYFDINPATGLNWTPGEAGSASLEYGVKSIA